MADIPTTNIQDSKKGQGMIIALIAGLIASAAAVAAGPVAVSILPDVLLFIAGVTGFHQGSQAVQDAFEAKNPIPPQDTEASK